MPKFTIIGMGAVGSTVAYSLTITGLASEIVMIDVNNDKALGEALDIRQGTPCSAITQFVLSITLLIFYHKPFLSGLPEFH